MTSEKLGHPGPISSSMTGRRNMRAASYNVMSLAKSLFGNRRYVELSGRLFSSRNILIPFVSCSLTQPPWAISTSTAKRGVPPISQLRFSSTRLGSFRPIIDIVQGLPQNQEGNSRYRQRRPFILRFRINVGFVSQSFWARNTTYSF